MGALLAAATAVYAGLYAVDLIKRKKTAPFIGALLLAAMSVAACVLGASYY